MSRQLLKNDSTKAIFVETSDTSKSSHCPCLMAVIRGTESVNRRHLIRRWTTGSESCHQWLLSQTQWSNHKRVNHPSTCCWSAFLLCLATWERHGHLSYYPLLCSIVSCHILDPPPVFGLFGSHFSLALLACFHFHSKSTWVAALHTHTHIHTPSFECRLKTCQHVQVPQWACWGPSRMLVVTETNSFKSLTG